MHQALDAQGAPHEPVQRLKLVSVLFVDVVGSTAMGGARLKAGLRALLHGSWEFLKAVGSCNIRDDMLEAAESVAATQPGLARRLRRAANGGWY